MHRRVSLLISRFWQNSPSPNERLSKGYRIADIKASAHASHKTHACISLKQRGNSHNGEVEIAIEREQFTEIVGNISSMDTNSLFW